MQNAGISTVLATNAKYFLPNNELKVGQIVVGKVNELAEDGTARIIINGKIITATVVEEALTKGKFYFEVKEFKDGKAELKVISEIKQNDQKNSMQILKELDIPFSKESDSVIKLFLQSERPINKGEVLEAINQLMKSPNKQLVLDSISFLIKKNFPITEKLLQTLVEGSQNELSNLLSNLTEIPDELQSNMSIKQLQSMIKLIQNNNRITNFRSEQSNLANQILISNDEPEVLTQWNNQFAVKNSENSAIFKESVFNNLFKLTGNSPTIAKTVLNEFSELPEFNSVKTELSRIPMNLANHVFSQLDDSLIDTNNNHANNLLSLNQNILKEITVKISNFITNHSNTGDFKTNLLTNILSSINENDHLNEMTKLFLQNQLLNGVNSTVDDSANDLFQLLNKHEFIGQDINSDQFAKQINKHNDLMGMDFENKLRHLTNLNKSALSEQFPTLKEIALKALNSNIPDSFKQSIEQLITKVSNQQITSVHQNGPEYHLSTTFPIFLNNWSTDLTIQWTGKESSTDSKQIQSNYCHILFFLELETLKETMVDVSIQNRVVNVTIFNNEEQLNTIISTTLPVIKESLAKHDFHLSTLKCLPFNNEQEKKVSEMKFNNSLLSSREYTGVDLFV
ncbi:hypothetical protein [Bacillus sp. EAC]|uniref:hypothetical protein n=1 Tax=Bacillus sp. EAC TaxID=1978338 RepID=UPI000B42E7CB|nr:hypothetical protein [Bacillus sp. EAC]